MKYGKDSEIANKLLMKLREDLGHTHESLEETLSQRHSHEVNFNRRVHRLSAEGVTQQESVKFQNSLR